MNINQNLPEKILSGVSDICYLIITDESGIIIDINDRLMDDFGYFNSNNIPLIGNVLHTDISHQDSMNTVLYFPKNVYKLKKNIRCADGQYVTIEWRSFAINVNNVKYTVTFGVDLTDWESVTQQLLAITQRLIKLSNIEQSLVEPITPKLKVS